MRRIRIALLLLLSVVFFVAEAQEVTVSGVVYDENGLTMPAVNVVEEGTTNGTITGADGSYTLTISDADATLVFSFIGYKDLEEPVNGRRQVDVTMAVDYSNIDEVVVVGYGTQKKSDLTGSVAVVDVDEMKTVSDHNVGNMIRGKVPGVVVTTDGQPGADPTIRIRGFSTFSSAAPLYVIDGIVVEGSPRDLSPGDIESMQILKDASAAAIYGSRAANGVIIITTKQGQKNAPLKFAYTGYLGLDDIYQEIPMLGRQNYQSVYNYSLENNGMDYRPGNDPDSDYYIDDVNTDWQEEAFVTGVRQNHNVAMTGGGENGTYAVILDYLDNKGTMTGVGPNYKRYSVRANNTVEKGIFKAGSYLFYSHTDQTALNVTSAGGFAGGNPAMIIKLLQLIPTMPVRDPSTPSGWGTYDTNIQGEDYSLNIIAVNNLLEDYATVDRMLASGFAELDFGKLLGLNNQSLKYRMNLSYDKTSVHDFRWIPDFVLSTFYTNNVATLDEGWREYTHGLVENLLNYSYVSDDFRLDAVVGQMFQADAFLTVNGHGEEFPKPYYKELSNAAITSSGSYEEASYLSSFLGRVNMDYGDRYLLTATVRRDATSRINRENRVGIFPSFSAGWKLHNEEFFPLGNDIVSQFKLRAGWGRLGNSAIGPYEYMAILNRNSVYNFNGERVIGTSEPSVVSSLIWETSTTTNIGLDMSFLRNKLDFTVEYYDKLSEDVLVQVNIPQTVGSIDNTPRANAATLRNRGLEFSSTYRNYDHAFKYEISANLSTLNNEVISLNITGQPRYGAAARTVEGEEVGRHFGYVYDGIFQTQEDVDTSAFQTASTAPGDIEYRDLDNDGTITEEDRADLGSAIPNIYYGFNVSFSYKGIDFSAFASGAAGYLVADYMYRNLMHSGGGLNWHEDILDFWREDNTNTDIPRVVYQDPNDNFRDSDRPGWLQKGDHLRIQNITLGYTFPETLVQKVDISNLRVYASVQNAWIFSSYKGYNPDFNNPDPFSPGFNGGSYPQPRSVMFGVNFNF
ncbi:MAG: TonB-dependent receptor [Bacteroidales bacterium]|nr:TonB-dependent receptor [Bacteroidales bacterium]